MIDKQLNNPNFDSTKTPEKKDVKSSIIVVVVIFWIGFSSMTQIANKEVISKGTSPLLLVCFQMFFGSIVYLFGWPIYNSFKKVEKIKKTSKEFQLERKWLFVVGVCNALTHLLTLYAIQMITPALTHIIRGTEPILIIWVSYLMLEKKSSAYEVISVILMILGIISIAVNQVNKQDGNGLVVFKGVLTTIAANFAIAIRNCGFKKFLLLAKRKLYYPEVCTYSLGFLVIPAITHYIFNLNHNLSIDTIKASVFHVGYSSMSFYVLSLINQTSHSVLKLLSRAVVVMSLTLVYGFEELNKMMLFGICFCVFGACLYSSSAKFEKKMTTKLKILLIFMPCFLIAFLYADMEKIRSLYVQKRFAYIPFQAWNTCNDRIKHLSCDKTVIAAASGAIALAPNLTDAICKHVFENTSLNVLDDASIMVCLQVGATVGAVVQLKESTSFSKPDILRFSKANDAKEVHSATYDKLSKIVDRAVVIMDGGYIPRSKKSNQARAKNGNRGNAIWSFGVTHLLNPFTNIYIADTEYKEHMSSFPKAYVIATANLFYLNDNSSSSSKKMDNLNNHLSSKITKFNLPTIMLGAGVQIDFSAMYMKAFLENDVLHSAHRHLLNALQKHNNGGFSVGVRGNMTEIACKNGGFNHCISLGCPSLTINRSPNLGHDLKSKWNKTLNKLKKRDKIKVGLTLPKLGLSKYTRHALMVHLEKIYKGNNDAYFILQSPADRDLASKIARQANIIIFDNVEDWTAFTADLDILISFRIHGGMAGIIAGTPAVIVPTDIRILELVNVMRLPSISIKEFLKADPDNLVSLLQLVEPDFDAFENNRRNKITDYLGILKRVGLEMDPALMVIHENKSN